MRQTFLLQGSCLSAWCSDFAPKRRRAARKSPLSTNRHAREPYGYWHSAGFAPAFPKAKALARRHHADRPRPHRILRPDEPLTRALWHKEAAPQRTASVFVDYSTALVARAVELAHPTSAPGSSRGARGPRRCNAGYSAHPPIRPQWQWLTPPESSRRT